MSDTQSTPWFVDDESNNRRFYIRPIFEIAEEAIDIDEVRTECSLVDIEVVIAEEFDQRGLIAQTITTPEARRFNDRAWRLLQKDAALLELWESQLPVFNAPTTCIPSPIPTVESTSSANTLAKMRELRQLKQSQENKPNQETERRTG